MLPILLDLASLKVILVGEGAAFEQRQALLNASGDGAHVVVYTNGARPSEEALKEARIVFVAGLPDEESGGIARIVRGSGGLVNVEDVKALCDFHMPSMVRRGDLVLTVSTGGKSPGLARRLRRHLETLFGPEWAGRLNELAEKRDDWRRQDVGMAEIGRRTDAYVEDKGWLP
ncbi:MAG: NAD(P)-dependent oxidoreductase [Parvibaculum sp.]|nr:NAD(P)-dependent oxidoreductase [Parvibaculum sp.]